MRHAARTIVRSGRTTAPQRSHTPGRGAGAGPSVSLRRLARETGLSLSHVSRVFSGQRQPSIRAARKIADALHVDLEAFLDCLPCRPHEVRVKVLGL